MTAGAITLLLTLHETWEVEASVTESTSRKSLTMISVAFPRHGQYVRFLSVELARVEAKRSVLHLPFASYTPKPVRR